ncbi:Angiotensin-converting enzyme-like 3 [Homarus americanus]|uniref:Angiotensin-converting enzyme n=1 Tax=Homarus americanus TaxID=6706 RepID=A0A8J5MNT4_HOMAM|nr:Angiotensin-converting enzyme-like 3 [Homarus americanus]
MVNAACDSYTRFKREAAVEASQYQYDGFSDLQLYRRFKLLANKGAGALDTHDLMEYEALQAYMERTYRTATACHFHDPNQCDLTIDPVEERRVWLIGETEYVEMAVECGEGGGVWRWRWSVEMAVECGDGGEVSNLVYKKLHAYVRMRLQKVYPGKIDLTGPIPAHILEMPSYDVTDSMVQNHWDIEKMFETAEDFFTGLGLYGMTKTFWQESVVNKTAWDKSMLCQPTAEDFCLGPEGDDYRIKMCTKVNMDDLITIHQEMGQIEYFMAYKNQPHVFRESAIPGFSEAIGDLVSLSVSTPQHLEKVLGLTPDRHSPAVSRQLGYTDVQKRDLNFLMKMALKKIAFFPFGYLVDLYRWGVFDQSIPLEQLNAGWWDLRESVQGVTPPAGQPRNEDFFDAGSNYHVAANMPYIRHFISLILQFQFHSHLCDTAGHTGPLYTCDISNNVAAGQILRSAMEKGSSQPWPLVVMELSGSLYLDSLPIINYFQPLIDYLEEALQEAYQCVGWGESTTVTANPRDDEEEARIKMADMNDKMSRCVHEATVADWTYYTNITGSHANASNAAWTTVSQKFKDFHESIISFYHYDSFGDETLIRQFKLQENLKTAALKDTDLQEDEMSTTGDYEKLKYYWLEWRESSWENMKDYYETYVKLMNIAATSDSNGFKNAEDMWIDAYTEGNYTADHFKHDIGDLWSQIQPLYEKLHAYVLHKLKGVKSYKGKFDEKDVNNTRDMLCLAENYYRSLGMYSMTSDFLKNSQIGRVDDRTVICHPTSWDLVSGYNDTTDEGQFRITMCSNTTQEDLLVMHHRMGQTEYQMYYSNEPMDTMPLVFRRAANPGFQEAVGGAITLSVSTPNHLEMIADVLNGGDLSELCDDGVVFEKPDVSDVVNIKFLMKTALEKIPLLSFAYIVDQWRWELFNKSDSEYNKEWWQKRLDVQGVFPPENRYPISNFDPGNLFEVAFSIPYISNFVGIILQFQIHRNLCELVGYNNETISNCDLYNKIEAGKALRYVT